MTPLDEHERTNVMKPFPGYQHCMWMVLLGLISLAVIAKVWLYQGWLVPRRIVGGSMAPYLVGKHYLQSCEDCHFTWTIDDQTINELTCPNCGWFGMFSSQLIPQQGDRLLVQHLRPTPANPLRWECVTVRSPLTAQKIVKRLIGFPHEQISIENGDIFINDEISRKNWQQLRPMAILVHDADHSPPTSSGCADRWRATNRETWRKNAAEFIWQEPAVKSGTNLPVLTDHRNKASWLMYHHVGCANTFLRRKPTPMTDHYAFNHNLSRNLQQVNDVFFTCNVRATGRGSLALRCHDGCQWHNLLWHPAAGTVEVEGPNGRLEQYDIRPRKNWTQIEIAFGTWDHQLVICSDDRELFRLHLETDKSIRLPVTTPLALLPVNWKTFKITSLKVWRDVYYLNPSTLVVPKSHQLDDDEYYVLGDNSPISIDSRHWREDGTSLSSTDILGRAIRFHTER